VSPVSEFEFVSAGDQALALSLLVGIVWEAASVGATGSNVTVVTTVTSERVAVTVVVDSSPWNPFIVTVETRLPPWWPFMVTVLAGPSPSTAQPLAWPVFDALATDKVDSSPWYPFIVTILAGLPPW